MRIGVDIGGTFTDLVVAEGDALRIHKLSSTPDDPSQAMIAGLNAVAGQLSRVAHVAHGSTVATNAILERKGARTALLLTQGFRDLLHIARQNRPQLYALYPQVPPPLIPREDCYEVAERMDHHGRALMDVDAAALAALAGLLWQQQYEAVAVCLLYSFVNPQHEQAAQAALLSAGFAPWQVVLSSEVLPEIREVERASTTALEAYVRPRMASYISRVRQELPAAAGLHIMKSDGGVMDAARVQQRAAHTALSGPAAGVIGAYSLAQLAGYRRIITLDMGGTSTDVALCDEGLPLANTNQIDGLPLRLRMLDIETIGAGGGSLARVDAGGALRVGPQSAGALPGPAAYGRGGEQPTVTDANLVLGRLQPRYFLGGRMRLLPEASQRVMQRLASAMGLDVMAAARGVIDIANAHIERALRRVSVERGHDPRHFALFAFGGAGPLHACEVAQRLEMSQVIVPPAPGVLCALGLLLADVRVDLSRPVLAAATRSVVAQVRAMQAELLKAGLDELRAQGIASQDMHFAITLDMRYRGQAYEISVPFEGDVVGAFHTLHERSYGHTLPDQEVEIVNMRLMASGRLPKPAITPRPHHPHEAPAIAPEFPSFYDREALLPGAFLAGEALIFQEDATTFVPEGWAGRVDAYGNLILERQTASG